MYQLKIGINQDKFDCIVRKGENKPWFYTNISIKDLKNVAEVTNVTS